jgi:hypothetical protein
VDEEEIVAEYPSADVRRARERRNSHDGRSPRAFIFNKMQSKQAPTSRDAAHKGKEDGCNYREPMDRGRQIVVGCNLAATLVFYACRGSENSFRSNIGLMAQTSATDLVLPTSR